MLAPVRKRPRSPSPPISPDAASPLDILMKRRKREELGMNWSPSYPSGSDEASRGIEKRRTRQWDKLQDPSSSQPLPNSSSFSPPSSYSQPDEMRKFDMSSSPIRHEPPSSSPFRAKGVQQQLHQEEDFNLEGEWGEEYCKQNTLLYNLHRARLETNSTSSSPFSSQSNHLTTPVPVLHTQLTPYRHTYTHPPSSSPCVTYSSETIVEEDTDMEIDHPHHDQVHPLDEREAEIKRRYEEANRLLGELAVVRMRRWGEA
ncbi:hypothetical protein P7C73_g4581, partial [Tremellales sp. Uapishka_1]